MSYSLEFFPAVRDEVEALKLWYELQRTGWGDEFFNDVIERFDLILNKRTHLQPGGRAFELSGSGAFHI